MARIHFMLNFTVYHIPRKQSLKLVQVAWKMFLQWLRGMAYNYADAFGYRALLRIGECSFKINLNELDSFLMHEYQYSLLHIFFLSLD